ncbi:MAG: hypothetical protein IH936_14960 [Acidobacteria bacterium]|nr:hypothetical protein [Acidobacteriota bacterium]
MRRSASHAILVLVLSSAAWGAERPAAVSPGDASKLALIGDACPTFSWGAVAGAKSYELVVYRIGEVSEEAGPVLSRHIAGSALSWTPSLDRCLERGGRYAWSVRAIGKKGSSDWSPPSLFQVAPGPSQMEFEEALTVVHRYLAADAGTNDPWRDSAVVLEGFDATEPQLELVSRPPVPAAPVAVGTAALSVEGEVRTVAPGGEPRLWGRGRPGTVVYHHVPPLGIATCQNGEVKFGLSLLAVPWGSAAEACPAGTWVCQRSDITPCDTDRPDSSADVLSCDGTSVDEPPGEHPGWLADISSVFTIFALAKRENTDTATTLLRRPCNHYPVWCCWN